jgi:predicted transcriptional regulator
MNEGMARPDIAVFDPASSKEEAQALDEAESAIAQGRTISNEAIRKWLRSWGKRDEFRSPKCGE